MTYEKSPPRARYEEYLQSPEWAKKRDAVMQRAKRNHPSPVCEICYMQWAVDVHHLTYVRRGHELLEDLIAVCRKCHEAEHGGETFASDPRFENRNERAQREGKEWRARLRRAWS